jgi:hypothetical protein
MLVFLLLAFICCCNCLQFSAESEIFANNAQLNAKIYYSDEKKVFRYDYSDPINMIDLIDYNKKIRYKYCGECESGYYNNNFPILTKEITDSIYNLDFNKTKYVKNNGNYLIYDNNNLQEFKIDNKIFKIKNYKDLSNNELNIFDYSSFSDNCPQPICKRIVDIVFNLDESGSIAEQEWEKVINFCKSIVSNYEVGYDAARFAIVGFGSFGIKHLDFSISKTEILSALDDLLNNQVRGGTCTGCGIMIAKSLFNNENNTERTKNYNPEHLLITVTDGKATHPNYHEPCEKQWSSYTLNNYCLGCCNSKYYAGCEAESYNKSCVIYNKTFELSGYKSCSKRSECKKSTYETNGYTCSGCDCDITCNYIICDSCTVNDYYSYGRCYQRTSFWGCKQNEYGEDFYLNNFTNSIIEIKKDSRLLSLAIGVGDYDKTQLTQIATELEGFKTVFEVGNYDDLQQILNQLISSTCLKMNDFDNCGANCLGFCGCKKKCYCPTCTKYAETCIENNCIVSDDGLESTGCVIKNIECNSDNKCLQITKNNNTIGCCEYSEITCNDNKFCTSDLCNENIGCVFIVNETICNDNNGCTIDKCNNESGCSNEFYDYCLPPDNCHIIDIPCLSISDSKCSPATFKEKCTCDNSCEIAECNNGICLCIPIDCSVNNSCLIGYCSNGKCLTRENITKTQECAILNDECHNWFCEDGECVNESIDCEACIANPIDCSYLNTACSKYHCQDINGNAICVKYWEMEINNDKCYGESCDSVLGFIQKPLNDYEKDCKIYKCVNGSYISYNKCDSDSFCYSYICENNTCIKKSNCEKFENNNKCMILKDCDEINKKCIYEEKNCDNTKCKTGICNKETGECGFIDISYNCRNTDLCIEYKCDDLLGCIYNNKSCDDNDICTFNYCENGTCITEEKCKPADGCDIVKCNMKGECIHTVKDCVPVNDSCHYSICENGTCKIKIKTSSFIDVCGKCVSEYGNELNKSNEGLCIGILTRKEFVEALTGAAIAGIVIACIVAAAIIGTVSTKITKELIDRAKKMRDTGINSNPLYETPENEGSNPLFVGVDEA